MDTYGTSALRKFVIPEIVFGSGARLLALCIPTTGGTSADVSQFSIITHPPQKRKIAIISKAVVPDVALIDPATLTTMETHLSAFEAY